MRTDSTSPRFRSGTVVVLLAVVVLAAVACGDDSSGSGSTTTTGTSHRTLTVPGDYSTISKAVDAAKPGDLVLISPGVYKEEVKVETEDIVIRGTDRNSVIIDGEFTRENGIQVFSNGVAVENLTVRNHTGNGVFFTGDYGKGVTLTGYRASYVTAYDNGDYGIYAFNATKGVFDHDYGSGSPDSAFYVGQCNPCDALLSNDTGETNMLGYSGTNSTGVQIVNSTFRNNRAGIVPNSLYSEKLHPNSGTTVAGNVVENNNNAAAPGSDTFAVAFGNGIILAGASDGVVTRNLVRGNVNGGISITDLPETENPDTKKKESFKPENNTVKENTATGNTYDLVYVTVNYASKPFGNCFEGNTFMLSFPANIETLMPCQKGVDTDLGDLSGILAKITPAPPNVDYKTVPAPPAQPSMPNAATAKAVPAKASNLTTKVDLDTIKVPTA
jgi:hypothetical protein